MSKNSTVYCIDAGNSFMKFAHFSDGQLITVNRIAYSDWSQFLKDLDLDVEFCIASVLDETQNKLYFENLPRKVMIKQKMRLPLVHNYESFETLGIDRICNVYGMLAKSDKKNLLSIDIGTCIKFDLLKDRIYHGGSISPGIDLRYKSLNDYTGKLPLLNSKSKVSFTGKSTKECIESGVLNGMQIEINGFLEHYTQNLTDLTIYITGGDAHFFDFPQNFNIFASSNLTIEGLYQIYLTNV